MLAELTIPMIYEGAKPGEHVLTMLREAKAEGKSRGVVLLFGPPGTGKTHDACALAQAFPRDRMRHGHSGIAFAPVADLSRMDQECIWAIKLAGIAVLDEMGLRMTEATTIALHSILEHRVTNRLPVIITGNITDEIKGRTDPRIGSRIMLGTQISYKHLPDRRKQ